MPRSTDNEKKQRTVMLDDDTNEKAFNLGKGIERTGGNVSAGLRRAVKFADAHKKQMREWEKEAAK